MCQARDGQLVVVQTAVSWEAQALAPEPVAPYLRIAADHRDAFMAVTSVAESDELAQLAGLESPSISVGGRPFREGGPEVIVDNIGGTKSAIRHLVEHGHERIGFVGPMSQYDVRERYEGYQAALEEAGLKADPTICYAAIEDIDVGGIQAADYMLDAGIPLTAVFVATDTQCVAFMDRLRTAGVRVPEDVAIIGFDDSELAQHAVPALTSVRQPPELLGATAASILLDALDGKPMDLRPHLIPTELVRRHSCGCFYDPSQRHLLEPDVDWTGPDWRSRLAEVMRRALDAWQLGGAERVDRTRTWPSVEVIVDALDDAIEGRRITRIGALDEAWFEASLRTRNAETLMRVVDLLEFVALCRQDGSCSQVNQLRAGLQDFLAQCRLQILRYSAIADPMRSKGVPHTPRNVARWFLEPPPEPRRSLDWLCFLDAISGCLAVWEPGSDFERLRIQALYGETGGTQGGSSIEPESFPPRQWLDACRVDGRPSTAIVVPIVMPHRPIGVLAVSFPPRQRYFGAYWNLQYAVAVLAGVLDRSRED